MLFHYQFSESSWWFRRPGGSENIHECSLRSDVNDTSVPAHADLIRRSLIVQMKSRRVIWSHITAVGKKMLSMCCQIFWKLYSNYAASVRKANICCCDQRRFCDSRNSQTNNKITRRGRVEWGMMQLEEIQKIYLLDKMAQPWLI